MDSAKEVVYIFWSTQASFILSLSLLSFYIIIFHVVDLVVVVCL